MLVQRDELISDITRKDDELGAKEDALKASTKSFCWERDSISWEWLNRYVIPPT